MEAMSALGWQLPLFVILKSKKWKNVSYIKDMLPGIQI